MRLIMFDGLRKKLISKVVRNFRKDLGSLANRIKLCDTVKLYDNKGGKQKCPSMFGLLVWTLMPNYYHIT